VNSLRRLGSLRALWLALVVTLALWLATTRWSAMAGLVDNLRPLSLALLIGASCLLLVPNAVFWTLALRSMGQQPRYTTVLVVSARALLTRYVPGGIWYAAGRGTLLRRHGIPMAASATVGGLELALGAPMAIVVGMVLLAVAGELAAWVAVVAVTALLVGLTVGGSLIDRLMTRWARRNGDEAHSIPRSATLLKLAAVLVGYWLAIGTLFWAYLEVVGPTALQWSRTVGAFGVSWGIGFFTLFAPQGIGVFEGALVTVLDWGTDAVLLVAGFRAVLLARDLLLTVVAELLVRRGRDQS
jgi:hypothetical protein